MNQAKVLMWVVVVALAVAACGTSAEDARAAINEKVENISVESVLEDLRDCDKLSDAFVGVVQTAADAVDELADKTDGRVPETEIRDVVDQVSSNKFFDVVEKIGCDRLQAKLDVVDQLNGVDPSSPAGDEFLDEILRNIEANV